MTSLRPDHWPLLLQLADAAGGWCAEDTAAPNRRRRTTAVEQLAEEQLCELAPTRILDALHDANGRRPGWAARILPDGLLAVRYRQLRGTVPRQAPAQHPELTSIEITSSELDILRRVLALAPHLPGLRTRALASALAQTLPVVGAARWSLTATTEQLAAIEAAFRLESMVDSCRSYHRFMREYRGTCYHPVSLAMSDPDDW